MDERHSAEKYRPNQTKSVTNYEVITHKKNHKAEKQEIRKESER